MFGLLKYGDSSNRFYYCCIPSRSFSASCNTAEKFIPLLWAVSFSHAGMVSVFLNRFLLLYNYLYLLRVLLDILFILIIKPIFNRCVYSNFVNHIIKYILWNNV